VRRPLIGLLALLVATLSWSATAVAKDTPTAAERSVMKDYRDDGVVTACDHPRAALQAVLDGITTEQDTETPDLRPIVQAAIEQHDKGDCQGTSGSGSGSSGSGTSGSGSSSGSGSGTGSTAGSGAGSGSSAGSGSGATTSDGGAAQPLDDGGGSTTNPGQAPSATTTLEPDDGGDATPAPGATTTLPATTPTPVPTPVVPAAPAATPALVYQNTDDPVPVVLLALGGLVVALALLALLYAVASRFGWGEDRLVRVRRAGREAAFRAGALWGDFGDWLRVGR
jgi:hypothetical protein